MLRVRNPAGENITPEVNVQTPLIADIMKSIEGKVNEAVIMNGKFVWKKWEIVNATISMTMIDSGASGTAIINIASNDFDVTKFDINELNGIKVNYTDGTTTWVLQFVDSSSVILDGNSYRMTWDTANAQMRIYVNFGPMVTFDSFSASVKSFEGYIVDDSETLYPDGGIKDGYWYERGEGFPLNLLGCTKYAVETLTPAQDILKNNAFNHSLGIVPQYVVIKSLSNFSNNTSTLYVLKFIAGPLGGHSMIRTYQGDSNNTASFKGTSTTLTLSSVALRAGVPYQIITIG